MLGKGFGETVDIAIKSASLDALCKIYGIHPNQNRFNFEIQLDNRNQKEKERLQQN